MVKNLNNIGYQGIVKIKILRGDNIVKIINHHNEGTDLLFKILASTLCGNNESSKMPKYIDLGNIENGVFTTNLTSRPNLTSKKVLENTQIDLEEGKSGTVSSGALFTATIPSRQILNSQKCNCLRLYYRYNVNDSHLAQIILNEDNLLDVNNTTSYTYIIEWFMTFDNVTSSTTSNSTSS